MSSNILCGEPYTNVGGNVFDCITNATTTMDEIPWSTGRSCNVHGFTSQAHVNGNDNHPLHMWMKYIQKRVLSKEGKP